MKKVVLNVIAAVLMVLGLSGIATISPAYADVLCADGTPTEWSGTTGIADNKDLMGTLTTIINVVVGVVGFVAVAMIVMGGISFATSQGDASKTTKARNTILYGVVGLVVALLAFAIVNFVSGAVFKSGSGGGSGSGDSSEDSGGSSSQGTGQNRADQYDR